LGVSSQNQMKPEEQSRKGIDNQLKKANWVIQDRQNINLGAGPGIAIREFQTKAGPVDYALFANRKAIGVIEAKPAGRTLSGVAEQTANYIRNFPENIPHISSPLPFAYESTGVETYFTYKRCIYKRIYWIKLMNNSIVTIRFRSEAYKW